MKRRKEKKIRLGKFKVSEQLLHDSIMKVIDAEDVMLKEEMKDVPPYIFSVEFERKMEEVMRVQTRVCKHSDVVRYLASAAVVILMVFGLLFIGNEDLRASDFRINVLEWFEDFFVVENDTNRDKDDENDVLFHESQIGYIPEGFEKVKEEVWYSKVCYKFENIRGEYISISVYKNRASAGIDGEDISQDIQLNVAGFEYRYVFKQESGEHIYTWTDEKGKFYMLSGLADKEDVMEFMNGILY